MRVVQPNDIKNRITCRHCGERSSTAAVVPVGVVVNALQEVSDKTGAGAIPAHTNSQSSGTAAAALPSKGSEDSQSFPTGKPSLRSDDGLPVGEPCPSVSRDQKAMPTGGLPNPKHDVGWEHRIKRAKGGGK